MSRLILLLAFLLAAVAFVPMSGRATNLEEPA